MPLSRRYSPEWAPGEAGVVAMDFSPIIPPGVGLIYGTLSIFWNLAQPVDATADFQFDPVHVTDRVVWCGLGGGLEGRDYQLRWTAHDTNGHVWPRTGLMLCAQTS